MTVSCLKHLCQACNDANAILTRSRYAGTYVMHHDPGWYRWEGLGGQGMDRKWLAGLLVSRVYLYVDCTGGRDWVVNG